LAYRDAVDVRARRLRVAGRVQGVGFRPFVYRLATSLGLTGSVRNVLGEVDVLVQGSPERLDLFARDLIDTAPPLARPHIVGDSEIPAAWLEDFQILSSDADAAPSIHLPPDYFTCEDCLNELRDPLARRYRYPFINCTQCGPRYTIIRSLPYDRPSTSMAGFVLCDACRSEYEDPLDRRFHAEPLACPVCGPSLSLVSADQTITGSATALAACVDALRAGGIVAIKGIGGYHLVCDARNDDAVKGLRARKSRPHKPLAVMFPMRGADGLDAVREETQLNDVAAATLVDPVRPIVLVPRRNDGRLAASIAPGLAEIGTFLPYSPLHHVLLDDFAGPLVATSGNVSGEPVLTREEDVEARLARVADAFLHHDRPIVRPADDSVLRVIAGAPRPIRLGRGLAPVELELDADLPEPVLAVGGHLKVTVALAWDRRVVVSPHISDLGSPRGQTVFEQVCADLQALYGVAATRLLCDHHPDYASTRWADTQGLPVTRTWHHRAHASAVAAEAPQHGTWLVFAWDGVGYGEDGSLWGGETFHGRRGDWRRVASLRPFRLPGGDRAGREPWRAAAALCWETGSALDVEVEGLDIARGAWERHLNSPQSSAVGRLFDAAATLVSGITHASYEGQGPMQLEALAVEAAALHPIELPLTRDEDDLWRLDWEPLLTMLSDASQAPGERALCFHVSLAEAIGVQVEQLRAALEIDAIGLGGGVFQNRLLSELVCERLARIGVPVYLCTRVPANDGGLSYGQVQEYLGASPWHSDNSSSRG
jgi:hydrogenase maturation protein HypF